MCVGGLVLRGVLRGDTEDVLVFEDVGAGEREGLRFVSGLELRRGFVPGLGLGNVNSARRNKSSPPL